jgi:mycothiol synthase
MQPGARDHRAATHAADDNNDDDDDVEIVPRRGEEGIVELSRLLSAVAAADGHAALGEHKWLDLVQGARTGVSGFVARSRSSGRQIGYIHLSKGEASWGIECVVHPRDRTDDGRVGSALLRTALDEIAAVGGGHVHLWVAKPTATHDAITEALGLRRGRDLYQMRCALPVEPIDLPPDTEEWKLRSFCPGTDEAAWLRVNNRAFAGHPEQGGWDRETLEAREREPWFDKEGFLLAERTGELGGFCWTKIHDETPPLGEIYVIAVDPGAQGHRLGALLVQAGLRYLTERGLRTAMLYVDADNEPALSLYRRIGFTVDHVDRAYVGDVAPAMRRQAGDLESGAP